MTRISKQGRRRAVSPRKPKLAGPKTGPKKDALEFGYKAHENTVIADTTPNRFIPKIGK
jgi:hypothetical protein